MTSEDFKSELFSLSDELMEAENAVKIKVTGVSMFPLLQNGDVVTIRKENPKDLKKGDIIGFKLSGKWVLHRLIKIKSGLGKYTFLTRGDTCRNFDKEINENDYIGKAISFSRKGKEYALNNPGRQIMGQIIARFPILFSRFFFILLAIHSKLTLIKNTFTTILHRLHFIIRDIKKTAFINFILSVFQGILPFVLIFMVKLTIDRISFIHTITDKENAWQSILIIVIFTGLVFFLNTIINLSGGYFREKLSHSISMKFHNLLHNKYCQLKISCLENSEQLDKIYRAVNESTFRPFRLVNQTLVLIQSLISLIIVAFMLFKVHYLVLILIIIAMIPGFFVRLKFAQALYRLNKQNSKNEREAFYYNRVLTGIPFAKEVRLFHFKNYFSDRFNLIKNKLFKNKEQLLTRRFLSEIFAQFFAVILLFGSFAYVAWLAVKGDLSVGMVVLFFLVFQRGFSVMNEMFHSLTNLYEDNVYLDDFFDFLQLPSEQSFSLNNISQNNLRIEKGIFIENVSFRYPSGSGNVLTNINIQIPAGKTIALVGLNGSGKTTLVKLLCRFYLPDAGKILIDDKDLLDIKEDEVRKLITAVFQDFALYNISAADNIALGNITEKKDYKKVAEAARNAGISDVLENLPDGYDNLLGNLFEKGEELSIGQWQKVAIARAFYRNSPFLIMDEPSSALDAETEYNLLQKLRELSKNKTVLIISHRLSAVQWADRIYLLDKGTVSESGTHEQLMKLNGKYAALFGQNRIF